MGRIEKTVFISYRRTNLPWALSIYQNLTSRGYDVFFDYENINSGDFEQIILGNIRARAHFLVVLTPSALERCENSNDWLRREIETAIDEKRNIVPLFLEGFNFGSPSIAKYLTGRLEVLKSYNGLNIPADYFNEAIERLCNRFLSISLDAVLHPVSAKVQKAVQSQQTSANKARQVKGRELTAQEWFEQGKKNLLYENYEEAIHCYTETIQLELNNAEAYNNRGAARRGIGDFDGAIIDCSEAIRLKPDCTDAYVNRGNARQDKNDLEGAIDDYNEAINIKPNNANAYFNRGFARGKKGDKDGELEDYNESIVFKPNFADSYSHRSAVYHERGDLDKAIEDANKAILLKPDLSEAYNNRGIAYQDRGDEDKALNDFAKAILLKPNNAHPYFNRAKIMAKRGNYHLAIEDLKTYLNVGGGTQNRNQTEVEEFINAIILLSDPE